MFYKCLCSYVMHFQVKSFPILHVLLFLVYLAILSKDQLNRVFGLSAKKSWPNRKAYPQTFVHFVSLVVKAFKVYFKQTMIFFPSNLTK